MCQPYIESATAFSDIHWKKDSTSDFRKNKGKLGVFNKLCVYWKN